MKSQTGQQIITMRILPNVTRSKHNQAMKYNNITIKYKIKYNK